MISLELLDNWLPNHVVWWAPYALVVTIPILLAWFPGANARQRAHDHAQYVSGASWLVALSIAGLFINSNCDLMLLIATFLMLWMGIVAWSYGKNEPPLVMDNARGFEIISPSEPAPMNLMLELASAE